jgi:hypothetical protein
LHPSATRESCRTQPARERAREHRHSKRDRDRDTGDIRTRQNETHRRGEGDSNPRCRARQTTVEAVLFAFGLLAGYRLICPASPGGRIAVKPAATTFWAKNMLRKVRNSSGCRGRCPPRSWRCHRRGECGRRPARGTRRSPPFDREFRAMISFGDDLFRARGDIGLAPAVEGRPHRLLGFARRNPDRLGPFNRPAPVLSSRPRGAGPPLCDQRKWPYRPFCLGESHPDRLGSPTG